ncbi:MAG: isoprenyl transferase [Kiritimatiellae bacterium]|nr:isoprenyl transferase [Kiritimatiellia bacterium]
MSSDSKSKSVVPAHVAIIMDGNGRWARQRGLPRIKGHEKGSESVRAIVKACRNAGVKYLTLYAFSVENWIRPKTEINALMRLLDRFLRNEEHELHENRVRLRVIGRREDLPSRLDEKLREVEARTRQYEDGNLILALSYGGRTELVKACRTIAQRVKDGELSPDEIDEDTVSANLYAPDIPDPDLLIRTSGELRVSNFLLWQISYAEFYVTDVLWPDFREPEFKEALADFSKRRRRFGDVK